MLALLRHDQELFPLDYPQEVLEAMERAVARTEVIAIRARAISIAVQRNDELIDKYDARKS